MTSYERLFWVHIEIATDVGTSTQGPAVNQLVAIMRVGICPWADAPNSVEYIRTSTYDILSPYRQNVVLVGAVGIADPLGLIRRLSNYVY